MKCPGCTESMIVLELEHIEIDYCPTCHGIWLDAGELELLLSDAEGKRALLSSFHEEIANAEARKRCPICSKIMNVVACGNGADGEGCRIDSCPAQHGLWFDRGELYTLLNNSPLGRYENVRAILRDMFEASPAH